MRPPPTLLAALTLFGLSCAPPSSDDSVTTDSSDATYFVGVSEPEDGGPAAWLIGLDSTRLSGSVYYPPEAESLCEWQVNGDSLRWSTRFSEFRGVRTGELTWTGSVARIPVVGFPRNASRMPTTIYGLQGLYDADSIVGRVYSSKHFNQETGDLLGHEVVLLRVRAELWALIGIGGGTFSLPSVARYVERSGDSITFSVQSGPSTIDVRGRFVPDGLRVAIGIGAPEVLPQVDSIASRLRNPRPSCPPQ